MSNKFKFYSINRLKGIISSAPYYTDEFGKEYTSEEVDLINQAIWAKTDNTARKRQIQQAKATKKDCTIILPYLVTNISLSLAERIYLKETYPNINILEAIK